MLDLNNAVNAIPLLESLKEYVISLIAGTEGHEKSKSKDYIYVAAQPKNAMFH